MKRELKEYIERKRKNSLEHALNARCFIRDLEAFISLLEKHKHYKNINNSVF